MRQFGAAIGGSVLRTAIYTDPSSDFVRMNSCCYGMRCPPLQALQVQLSKPASMWLTGIQPWATVPLTGQAGLGNRLFSLIEAAQREPALRICSCDRICGFCSCTARSAWHAEQS